MLRTYSVFDYDGSVLQMCVLDHGDGPGARWARAARPGDLVRLSAPQGRMAVRAGRTAAASSGLIAAVAGLDLPPMPGLAYVAGEARTVQAVRSHLVWERGWPRRQVVTKPYWTPGRTGLD